jgi:uncharacterized protein (TIGR04255 family)
MEFTGPRAQQVSTARTSCELTRNPRRPNGENVGTPSVRSDQTGIKNLRFADRFGPRIAELSDYSVAFWPVSVDFLRQSPHSSSRTDLNKSRMPPTDKLRDDPIVEALLDVRFASPELSEIVVGRLSDIDLWHGLTKDRLPSASIPEPLRAINPNLQFMPTIEIRGAAGIGAVRIGGNVLGLHFVHPYGGWEDVFPRIERVMDAMFKAVPTLVISRLSLRYINVFTTSRHGVDSVYDLAVFLRVGETVIDGPINVTFATESGEHVSQTRLASRHFLQGQLANDATVAADIDVFTPSAFTCKSADAAKMWINLAHSEEKKLFRRLLPNDLYEKLRSPPQ